MKTASTKRYYVTNEELQKKLEIDGVIETVHQVTPYEKDQDVDLKDVDFVITTVIELEDLEDVKDDIVRTNELDRHLGGK